MRYRIYISLEVDERDDRSAHDAAKKLQELLRSPIVRMAVDGAGVRLGPEDGRPIVYAPRRVGAGS